MSCSGVFFAIDEETVNTLRKEKRSEAVEYLQENIEEVLYGDRTG